MGTIYWLQREPEKETGGALLMEELKELLWHLKIITYKASSASQYELWVHNLLMGWEDTCSKY